MVVSCRSSVTEPRTEMEFSVDSLLVNRQVNDSILSISYRIPSTWTAIDASVNQQSGVKISSLFTNADTSVMFSTTDLRNMSDSSLRAMHDNYKTVLNPDGKWNSIDAADFVKDDFQITQYMMSKQGTTGFKMFFSKNSRHLFQLDYQITIDSLYETKTKIFESIIGTLRSIN